VSDSDPVPERQPAISPTSPRQDVGATHLALVVTDVTRSISFYERYARMQVVHDRHEHGGRRVVWLSDLTRPFVVVLIEGHVDARLGGFCHLGVGCKTRDEVDRLCAAGRPEGCLAQGPIESGSPVGYWAFLRDPDGHNLEISFGQEVGLAVARVRADVETGD
jgi:catechol 2,3-dioxygenase-like lactoylglutathione lyase family enzyme